VHRCFTHGVVAVAWLVVARPARAEDLLALRTIFTDPSQLASWLAGRDAPTEAARARHAAAVESARQASVYPNPQLSASLGGLVLGATNPSSPRLGFDQTTNITGGISELFEIGKRGPRQQAARLRADEAGQISGAVLGARIGEATATLGKLAYVAARRAAVAGNLEAARELLGIERVRRDHADLAGVEFSRIELDTQQLELQLGRSDADVATAVAQCAALLRAPCPAADLADPAALDAGAPLPATLPVRDEAIAHRPGREASRLEARALGADATLAAHRWIPDPTVGVGYTYDNLTVAGNQPQTMLLTLSMPLPVFDRGEHDAAAAHATARAILADDEAAVREASGQVDALLAQRSSLQHVLDALEHDALLKSAQIVQQTRRSFDLGQAGLADLLLAERAHRELLLDVLDTRFELFNVRAQLRQQLGLDDDAARAASP
jgi:cobalt-zinc-cadmium efflux system outer membrane protein